jgi:predicted signal transduction protein with EAL and GGDEF domain
MKAIAEPFVVNGQLLPVAASIGVAVYPDDDADIETLIEKADLAMYAAKQRGKGASLRFLPSMQARAYSSLILKRRCATRRRTMNSSSPTSPS